MSLRLEFDGIEKYFDERAVLSSIHMACDSGTITGLLGRNGSGKTTLMKIVFGTTSATSKSVRINGKALLGNYLNQRIIGYLPQQGFIPRYLKVSEALSYFNIVPSTPLNIFPDFETGLNKPVRTLSGGYLRILETLIVLKSRCSFVMLDEPFSGLMPLHIEMMKKVILEEKTNKGIIISDHLYRHILDISEKTYLLSNGKTYIIESANELTERGYLIAGDN